MLQLKPAGMTETRFKQFKGLTDPERRSTLQGRNKAAITVQPVRLITPMPQLTLAEEKTTGMGILWSLKDNIPTRYTTKGRSSRFFEQLRFLKRTINVKPIHQMWVPTKFNSLWQQ